MRFFLSALISLLLFGCAAPNVDQTFDISKATTSGVVVGSITYEGAYGAYILHIQSKETSTKYRLQHGSGQTLNPMLAFRGEAAAAKLGKTGSVFAVELPTGSYTLTGWQISVGAANVWSTAPTGIEFKVEPKSSIYIGNFDFKVTDTFMRNPSKAVVTLSDLRARDLDLFSETFPKLAAVPVTQAITENLSVTAVGGGSAGRITIPIFIPIVR
jgi:hypothetical protein